MSTINDQIKTERQPQCPICGFDGEIKYENLTDHLFGAMGKWTMKECTSTKCRSLWLDPRPTPEDIGKAYQKYYTHGVDQQRSFIKRAVRFLSAEVAASKYGFSSSRLPWPGKYLASLVASLYPGLKAHLELQIRYLPAKSMGNSKLLDLGCGDGEALELLRDLGWNVCGVEIDPQGVSAARNRGLDVHQGTIMDACFPDMAFDAVTSSHVIEHLHDPQAFLAESHRVLRKGGSLVVVTPNASAWTLGHHGIYWLNLDPPRHLALFTAESLRNYAMTAGWHNVQVVTTARAIALTEIASSKMRDDGYYQWGQWPGFITWIRAQIKQVFVSISLKFGLIQGDELVLTATK